MVKKRDTLKTKRAFVESLIGDAPVNLSESDNFLKPRKPKTVRRVNREESDESFSRRQVAASESITSIEEVVRLEEPDEWRPRSETTEVPTWAKLSLSCTQPNRSLAKTRKN